ncbi:MAG: alanine--tRNA ligase [Clostridia bacterium]
MQGKEIRSKFLDYFISKGHTKQPSSSLVPHNDPTLLFTNAGMVQFKDVFLGLDKKEYKRATTSQKCVRAGGKHNDLDTVGRTARHHTFFEMLGNFSFGDYFKTDAIKYAWEFLTVELGLPKEKLYVTVFETDDEAESIWQRETDVLPTQIVRLGEKDNFWSMGETGPCGPCSEIIIDRGVEYSCKEEICALGACDCDRWLEIWNLVFMQYERDINGTMTALPRPSIDTGMGLERITAVMQNVSSNYETDLIAPLIQKVEEISAKKYDKGEAGFPFRVIADHARSCTFLIADGILPGNEGRSYVLRRILRRAVRFGKFLGIEKIFLYRFVEVVEALMSDVYPEISEKRDYIESVIRMEEERFQETLQDGLSVIQDMIKRAQAMKINTITGKEAFLLYDTYGFPMDLTEDIAEEHKMLVDKAGFTAAMAEQKNRSKEAHAQSKNLDNMTALNNILAEFPATSFVGYTDFSTKCRLLALVQNNQLVQELSEGEAIAIFDKTPCYAESGGQVGDGGVVIGAFGKAEITDTQKLPDGKFIHMLNLITGTITAATDVIVEIADEERMASARNHSATHLLQRALKEVVGDFVNQAGSYVSQERFRFDFNNFEPLTGDQITQIEVKVNEAIYRNMSVQTQVMPIADAKKLGAMALFGEKYGDQVRVVSMGDYSRELCGGTHVQNTGSIGLCKIISETGIGSGLRRIEAVTGKGAIAYYRKEEQELKNIANLLKAASLNQLPEKVDAVLKESKEKDREIDRLNVELAKYQSDDLLSQVQIVKGIQVLAVAVLSKDLDTLRNVADMFRDKLGSGVIVLGAVADDKVNFVVMLTKDVQEKGLHAGKIIKEVATIAGGSGGGRPDMAQAGGKQPEKLAEALAAVAGIVDKSI